MIAVPVAQRRNSLRLKLPLSVNSHSLGAEFWCHFLGQSGLWFRRFQERRTGTGPYVRSKDLDDSVSRSPFAHAVDNSVDATIISRCVNVHVR